MARSYDLASVGFKVKPPQGAYYVMTDIAHFGFERSFARAFIAQAEQASGIRSGNHDLAVGPARHGHAGSEPAARKGDGDESADDDLYRFHGRAFLLFIAECLDGVQPRGAHRRIETEDDADRDRDADGDGDPQGAEFTVSQFTPPG